MNSTVTGLPHASDAQVNTVARPVVFLHVPKTAGSSLAHALLLKYRRRDTYVVHKNLPEHIDRFARLPVEQRQRIRLVRGHMPFGLHEHLPGSAVYIAMLRDPVDRIVSHYYYVLRRPAHRLHDRVASTNMSIDEYVSSGLSVEMDNGQTRLLSGSGNDVAFGQCTRCHLEQAVGNVQSHFATVGLSERFDESLLIMQAVLGWRTPPLYLRRNVSKRRPQRDGLPVETVRTIERHNQLDLELYETVAKMFDDQRDRYVTERSLRRFEAVNGLYQSFAPPLVGLLTQWRRRARARSGQTAS